MSKLLTSISWQTTQHLTRGILAMLVSSSIARSYGERGLGLLDSSYALVNLLAGLASLGMQRIITRELCSDNNKHDAIKGTSIIILSIASVFAMLGANVYVLQSPIEERLIVLGASILIIIQPFGFIVSSIFEANSRVDLIGKIMFVGLIISTIVRMLSILTNAGLHWLSASYSIDLGLSTVLAWIVANSLFRNLLKGWGFDWIIAKSLLMESFPLLLSSIIAFVYISMDILMLKEMVGYNEAGIYGAAIRISQIPLFLPGIILGSYTSRLMFSWSKFGFFNPNEIVKINRILICTGMIVLLGGLLLGPLAVKTLYGDEFVRSGQILQVHVIGVFFMFIGSIRNHLLILEGRAKFILLCDSLGAITNLTLNLSLIPTYGAMGASIATLISYFVSFVLINYMHPSLYKYNNSLFMAFKRNYL